MQDPAFALQDARECGLSIDGSRLTHICRADDTWLLARLATELDWMIGALEQTAHDLAGLDLRLGKCTWARIQRSGRDAAELRPTSTCGNLHRMAELPAGQCLRVLSAYVQTDGSRDLEFKEVIRVAWAAFHAKQALWRTPGHLVQKLRVLQMKVFASMSWVVGTRRMMAANGRGLPAICPPDQPMGQGKWGGCAHPSMGRRRCHIVVAVGRPRWPAVRHRTLALGFASGAVARRVAAPHDPRHEPQRRRRHAPSQRASQIRQATVGRTAPAAPHRRRLGTAMVRRGI